MSSFIVSSGLIVSSGQTVSGAMIPAYGSAVILGGGTLLASTINLSATVTVSAGGVLSGVLDSGTIDNSGIASATVVVKGFLHEPLGILNELAGGLDSNTVLISGGTEYVHAGGSAVDTAIDFIGSQVIEGGSATSAVVSGGLQSIVSGSAAFTTVLAGGEQLVSGLMGARDTVVSSGGEVMAVHDGNVIGATVLSGGNATVQGPTATFSGTIASGALLVAQFGRSGAIVLSGAIVQDGGTLVLLDGAIETGATLQQGAVVISALVTVDGSEGEVISAGGKSLAAATVSASQSAMVYRGGEAIDFTLRTGGLFFVASGGVASATTIAGHLSGDGIDLASVITSGGLDNDKTSDDASVQAGGTLMALATSNATIGAGGIQIAGRITKHTQIESGGQVLLGQYSQVPVTRADVYSGGALVMETQGGSVVSATIARGGDLVVALAGNIVSGAVVKAGGTLLLQQALPAGSVPGDTFTNVVLSSGAVLAELGSATIENGITLDAGARVISGALGLFTNGHLTTLTNRLADNNVASGSSEVLDSGGIATSATVAGDLTVSAGGSATDTIVTSGGFLENVGGTVATATIDSGAQASVGEGSTSGILVAAGGELIADGSAEATVVAGVENSDAGTQTGDVVLSGGLVAQSFSTTSGAVIQFGGTLDLSFEATADGAVIQSGGLLNDDIANTLTATSMYVGGTLDLLQFAYASNTRVALGAGDVLTISGGGHSMQLQMAGNYVNDVFHAGLVPLFGGTMITLSAATAVAAAPATHGDLLGLAPVSEAAPNMPVAATGGAAEADPHPMQDAIDWLPHLA